MISVWLIKDKNLFKQNKQNKTVMFVIQGKDNMQSFVKNRLFFQTTKTGFGHPKLIFLKLIFHLSY